MRLAHAKRMPNLVCRVQTHVIWVLKPDLHFATSSQLKQLTIDDMSFLTYSLSMNPTDKPLVWLSGEVKTPPLSKDARIEAGYLLRMLQAGQSLSLPHSRPMPSVGPRCHELRINDEDSTWRILYRIDDHAILILEVFQKKTAKTPKSVIETCQRRAKKYDSDS
jgi:phage-related protein